MKTGRYTQARTTPHAPALAIHTRFVTGCRHTTNICTLHITSAQNRSPSLIQNRNGYGTGRPEEPKPVPFPGTQTSRAHVIMADPGHTYVAVNHYAG